GGGDAATYVLWHLARHHDVAVNRVLRGLDETVVDWTDQLGVDDDLWRGLAEGEDADLVDVLDPEAVEGYLLATLDRTRTWLDEADLSILDRPPADTGLDTDGALADLGVPEDQMGWLYDMWRGKPPTFFLSWEAIGHGVNHLGELTSIRNRMGLSPF
ncbi:MAG: hypothetical protein AAFO29_05115, partial [Actinomycetota bacterium]